MANSGQLFFRFVSAVALVLSVAAFLAATRQADSSHLPNLTVASVAWQSETGGTIRNRIWAGSLNIGDELIWADPGLAAWPSCRLKLPSTVLEGFCSNKKGMPVGNTVVVAMNGSPLHVEGFARPGTILGIYDPGDSPTNEYTLEGLFPEGSPSLRAMLGYNVATVIGPTTDGSAYLCFGPANSRSQHTNVLDACVERVGGQFSPDLKFTAGDKYILLSELVTLVGR